MIRSRASSELRNDRTAWAASEEAGVPASQAREDYGSWTYGSVNADFTLSGSSGGTTLQVRVLQPQLQSCHKGIADNELRSQQSIDRAGGSLGFGGSRQPALRRRSRRTGTFCRTRK